MKNKTFVGNLPQFAKKTHPSCTDDEESIFTLEALYREINKLKDSKAIGVDRVSLIIVNQFRNVLPVQSLIIFKRVSSKALFLFSES